MVKDGEENTATNSELAKFSLNFLRSINLLLICPNFSEHLSPFSRSRSRDIGRSYKNNSRPAIACVMQSKIKSKR